jgi:hypothetical protein
VIGIAEGDFVGGGVGTGVGNTNLGVHLHVY